jgi:hypothetical protein
VLAFFVRCALRVADKHSRRIARNLTDAPQPDGWTRVHIEAERRVRDREKAKITLPSPEHLTLIMRDAPSLEDVMNERADDELRTRSERCHVRVIARN